MNKIMKRFFEICQYKINVGEKYCWDCYGPDAFFLDAEIDEFTLSIIFDTENQTVYEMTAINSTEGYRWSNPETVQKRKDEAAIRCIDDTIVCDAITYNEMETSEKFFEVISKPVTNITIDLSDEEWYALMKMAHERDITLNQLVNQILAEMLENQK